MNAVILGGIAYHVIVMHFQVTGTPPVASDVLSFLPAKRLSKFYHSTVGHFGTPPYCIQCFYQTVIYTLLFSLIILM